MGENTDIRALVESKADDLVPMLESAGMSLPAFKETIFQMWADPETGPMLHKCTPASILAGVMNVAALGFNFSKQLGHAYLVGYGNTATVIIGYKGLIRLATESGAALDFRPGIRCQNDEWSFNPLHPTQPIMHVPAEQGKRGPILGYYCVVFLPNGLVRGEYMTKAEVEAHRDKYAKTRKIWDAQFDSQAMKTLVRRSCKYLRLSGKLAQAVAIDEPADLYGGEDLPPDILPKGDPAPEPPAKSEKLTLVPDADLSDAETTVIIAAAKKAGVRLSDLPQWISSQETLDIAIDDLSELKASHVSSVLKALEAYQNG